MPLMWYLNDLATIPEVSKENFEDQLHVLLFPRRRQIAPTNVVDFDAKLASAQKRHTQWACHAI